MNMTSESPPVMPADVVRLMAVERRLSLLERRVGFYEHRLASVAVARGADLSSVGAATAAAVAQSDEGGRP
ncbi:MAG: hypothetical protein KC620_09715 [Myxococcales bacterium]|nr:hypothetical protein [Myxococcales bacterium]